MCTGCRGSLTFSPPRPLGARCETNILRTVCSPWSIRFGLFRFHGAESIGRYRLRGGRRKARGILSTSPSIRYASPGAPRPKGTSKNSRRPPACGSSKGRNPRRSPFRIRQRGLRRPQSLRFALRDFRGRAPIISRIRGRTKS